MISIGNVCLDVHISEFGFAILSFWGKRFELTVPINWKLKSFLMDDDL